MSINDVKLGHNQPLVGAQSTRNDKLAVSEEWRKKIAALGAKHGEETAQWVKGGQNVLHAETMGARHTQEASTLYRDFVESNGGKFSGMVKNHSLANIQSRISDDGGKLGNKYTAAWHEIFSSAFKTEHENHGVESVQLEEGDSKTSRQGTLDILL